MTDFGVRKREDENDFRERDISGPKKERKMNNLNIARIQLARFH